jgi:hypothetical protein
LQDEEHNRSSGCTADSPPLDAQYCIGSRDGDGEASPKLKADVRGRTVLLRVVCREKKGVLIMVLKELEKHGLSIINTHVLPLAESSSLNITIIAQVNHVKKERLLEIYSRILGNKGFELHRQSTGDCVHLAPSCGLHTPSFSKQRFSKV